MPIRLVNHYPGKGPPSSIFLRTLCGLLVWVFDISVDGLQILAACFRGVEYSLLCHVTEPAKKHYYKHKINFLHWFYLL